ncbi:putative hydrolase [Quadrisphaera granulorum]|uniref:Putative hydrolase n=1 Tax=Quadrisphaera granulorum TaxID=317664 RepID=A0A316A1I2_9ACTN|nr:PHP domain-containing protein [Quadrisphaera granulorum]PWJ51796.1 putative hydrolase [Quadrisphaera granulorum]SZE97743.1 putative hydrolase [Quadrisphaera granulorum]
MHPVDALRRTAFLLEREQAATPRVKAFRTAATVLGGLPEEELAQRVAAGTLTELRGVGPRTAAVATQAAQGLEPDYLAELEERRRASGDLVELDDDAAALLAALRGDLHVHTDWSDGGSPPQEVAATAVELGHEYLALTDHSGGLRVANGLSPRRLERQLDLVDALAGQLAPFRLLSGIEVDITEDGGLDCPDELLERVDVVVASVHSKLGGRSSSEEMTARMLGALEHPRVRVLGHCTGRLVAKGADQPTSRRPAQRPEAPFDAAAVFARCAQRGVAVEVNARPERLDPPMRLLRQALEAGCLVSIDTDAHAPGQLDWRAFGAARAAAAGVDHGRVVTTWPVERLLGWLRVAG